MSSEETVFYIPPAPPSPPPYLSLLITNPSTTVTILCTVPELPQDELVKAKDQFWQLEGGHEIQAPEIICYKYVKPILQEGPKCGLVALSMVSTCTSEFCNVTTLLEEAQARGFTSQGEMFSVDDMATLARATLGRECCEVEVLSSGLADKEYILGKLKGGCLLLVPYDADCNDLPCCRSGHKAHWAVLCGALTSRQTLHVLVRQGKSRRLAVWPYDQLQLSNENLWEMDPKRAQDGKLYVLPEGGVEAGLRGRAILIHLSGTVEEASSH